MIAAHLSLHANEARKLAVASATPDGIVIDLQCLRGAHWFPVRLTLAPEAASLLADKLNEAYEAAAIGAARSGSA